MVLKKLINSLIVSVFCLVSVFASADARWIDVRTAEEYKADHIEGDLRITHDNIVKEVTSIFPDKDAALILYCRSGRRAGIAKQALEAEGYTNVKNAGGIEDAREQRGLSMSSGDKN